MKIFRGISIPRPSARIWTYPFPIPSVLLYPNQYVNFNSASAAVQKGAELSAGVTDQLGVVSAVYNYVVKNLTYDTAKASSVQSGYLPNVDLVLAQKKESALTMRLL